MIKYHLDVVEPDNVLLLICASGEQVAAIF